MAADANNTPVLGITDGTESGTQFVKALGKTPFLTQLTPLGSRVLFVDGAGTATGIEPYVTDGTTRGTQLVKDLVPGSGSSSCIVLGIDPSRLRAVLYAPTMTNGPAVLITDGTSAGTVMLAQVAASSYDIAWLDSKRFVFGGYDAAAGSEPWVSDGTPSGTRRLTDLRVGISSSSPTSFIANGGAVYFRASDGQSFSLYRTDGASVTKVAVLGPLASRQFESPVVFRGQVFFASSTPAHGTELFATDGTAQGTRLVVDLEPGAGSAEPRLLTALGTTLFFTASNSASGRELWSTSGNSVSTSLVVDLTPGAASTKFFTMSALSSSLLCFAADDGIHGQEIWTTDGSAAGTRRYDLYDVPNATSDTRPFEFVSLGERAVFLAGDTASSRTLWTTDATTGGTNALRPAPFDVRGRVVSIGSRALFLANNGGPSSLWETDGTAARTKVAIANPTVNELRPLGQDRALYVSAQGLGVTDGTVLGSSLFHGPVPSSAVVHSRQRRDGSFAFVDGKSFWISDGTAAGTKKGFDLCSTNLCIRLVREIVSFGSGWLFCGGTDSEGFEPWFTDGTASGTRIVQDIRVGSAGSEPRGFQIQDGRVWFRADDGVHGDELWQSDGTWLGPSSSPTPCRDLVVSSLAT